ncbi:MAG: N-acetylmuramoyl-L-alanine amidase [Myxococcales bacterium]|nr:N-acetylmuramoyl-L-alanine amidase [Myxococcales bacterium]
MKWIALAVAFVGCTTAPAPEAGPVARIVDAAAKEASVPPELLLAIAIEEQGIALPAFRIVREDDNVPVAGLLELRHGRLDTLALGAQLMGTTEDALRMDTDLATRAGAHVLASLGMQYGASDSFETWRRALEVLSGMDDDNARAYANRVFAILRAGGTFDARDGEIVELAAHPEIAAPEAVPLLVPPPASDFPGATWFTTSCTNKCTPGRPLGNASINKIVIHDTEGGWNGSVATLQNDPGKSVHYIIDSDGSRVGQFRAETDTTWHAGNFYYNETSVGIEHVGTAANPAGYSAALYAKSRELVKNIRSRWSIPVDRTHIVGHYQIPDGTVIAESSAPCTATLGTCETSASYGGADNHRDPGYNWQWCQYMESLGGSCTCNDAYPLWNCTTDKTEAVRCVNGTVEIEACPGGCDVQPVGTEDVCHTAGSGTPDGGVPDADPGNPDMGGKSGGCSAGRGGGSIVLLFAIALIISRRRR